MYKIEYKNDKNIFFVSVEGYMDSDEISRFTEEFRDQSDQLEEGFILVNDMSRFTPPSDDVFLIIREFMELMKRKKPGKVIRILDPDNTGAMVQIFQSEELAGIDYEVITVRSPEEAMKHIEE